MYPEGEMGQVYESIMSEDGVKKEDMFRSQKLVLFPFLLGKR